MPEPQAYARLRKTAMNQSATIADIAQRLAAAGIELTWVARHDTDVVLTMVQWSGLTRVLRELVTGKGMMLLLGGMLIGLLSGKKGYEQVAPLFDTPFRGVLTIFLLEVGLVTGRRLADLKSVGSFLGVFAVVMPLLHGLLGVWLGRWTGLGAGGATVLGTLAASASYIAAPAAVRAVMVARASSEALHGPSLGEGGQVGRGAGLEAAIGGEEGEYGPAAAEAVRDGEGGTADAARPTRTSSQPT